LPFDPNFVTYVWFDALVNYISVPASLGDPAILNALAPYLPPDFRASTGERHLWGNDDQAEVIHVIGKDIVKFHAVYWPIMLHAARLPVPKRLLVHGFWHKDGEKMSKTTGNVVDPISIINEWGVDAFRYYVTRELDIGPDGNWTDAGFQARYHAELANGLGNLVNRSLSMLKRYREGIVPARSEQNQSELSQKLQAEALRSMTESRACLLQFSLQDALKNIWALVTQANQYVDQTAPFKLAKDPSKAAQLDEVLYDLAETCRVLAVLLWPFLPDTATKIYAQLGLAGGVDKFDHARWGGLTSGHRIGEPVPLFPRKDQPKASTP
jgi:methionyl-tRNA synthetase